MTAAEERTRRWRLLLGAAADEPLGTGAAPGAPGTGPGTAPGPAGLGREDRAVDAALAGLYDGDGSRRAAGLGRSAPRVARWLGDIRGYFPSSVVQVLQRDAVDRLGLGELLLEPELLATVQPDVHLVATLVALGRVLPERTRETAREVVRTVVEQIERRLADRTRAAVTGALDRSSRTHRPRPGDIDWNRTVAANLRHYLPEHRTVVPERLVGHARRSRIVAKDVVVAVDQSASMAESVVHASVLAAVLAGIRTLRTSLVVFDTAVVDLTDRLEDPVEVLFGCRLGGGTDIEAAVGYCATLVTRPADTVLLLVTDLFEGGDAGTLLRRLGRLRAAGVTVVVLLALSDAGAPAHDHELAAAVAELGIPAFACTPDAFPDLLAVALERGDVGRWASAAQLAARQR